MKINIINSLLIILLPAALLFYSCDIFDARPAEKPEQPSGNFQQAFEPETVIQNLINSLIDRNVTNYTKCFSDTNFSGKKFMFSPTAGSALRYPVYANEWGIKNEEEYFNNLVTLAQQNKLITLTFADSVYNKGDSTIFSATYTLNVPQENNSIPQDYHGELRFSMIRDNSSVWRIYYWVDIKKDETPTWSELKGRLIN